MTVSWQFLRGLLLFVAFATCLGWVLWHWLKRTQDDPVVLVLKWVVSATLLIVAASAVLTLGPLGPGLAAACAIALAWLWYKNVGGFFAGLITGGYDGGDTPPELKPVYSIAEGLRKRGRHQEAAGELRKQLEKFPGDFRCETMLAEICAEHLGEFQLAEAALGRIANNPKRAPGERAYALNQIADWHLKFHQDPDAARAALERLQQFLPGTEFARVAAQRAAHLVAPSAFAEAADRTPIVLPHLEEGSTPEQRHAEATVNANEEFDALVNHLNAHPSDAEARTNLARLYAEQFSSPDLAAQEIERLIGAPNQSPREIARWLNLKADFQAKYAADLDGARATLQRIVEQFPGSAWATSAEQRIASLKNELRAKQKSPTLRLGSYEEDLGLR